MSRRAVWLFGLIGMLAAASTAPGDLIGYWPLNEGSGGEVIDMTGNGHDGTIEGATWASPGWEGTGVCLEFDGSNDLVRIPDAADLRFGAGAAYTLTAWVNFTVLPGHWSGVVTKGRETGNWYGIWVDPSNQWVFGHQPANHMGSPIVAGVWTHVAMVYDNSAKSIYLNGQLDSEATTSASGDNTAELIFGAALGVTEFAPIQLNEVRIYNHALNEEEVLASMESLAASELASDPVPGNDVGDVPRDGDLSWVPGEFAAAHDVYFGTTFADVNAASRSNPLDVLLSQGQTESTVDPGRLEFGQTYYWRVDEVNGAPDHTIFKGMVWSFTTEPFAYAVGNIVATSNGVVDGTAGPGNTVNGSGLGDNDEHSIAATDMWLAFPGVEPLWIQYEFDRVYKLHELLVWNYNVQFEPILGFGLKDVTVEYSENGEDWVVLGDVTLNQATAAPDYVANTVVEFGGVAARVVRLRIQSGYGPMGQFGLSEVRFTYIPVQAREPQPADGADGVDVGTALSWRAGREAALHDVYLGSGPDALALVDSVSEASYAPSDLQFGAMYYWQIVEVNETEAVNSWASDVWSLVTQEYAVIDDFESYDDEENCIFDTWLDGFVNETGATVGYFEAPFAEQTIVNGGGQSMPLEYDNSGAPFCSEAELDLGSADWNANGADTLRLFVSGQVDNAAEPLYVVVEDASGAVAVVVHPDAGITATPAWTEWVIPYSDLAGVNLDRVATMTIGVGDRGNPAAGGTGLIFIDDVGYGHPASGQ